MPNYGICDIPALPNLIRAAKIEHSAAAIVSLSANQKVVHFPSSPTVGKILQRAQLVKHGVAQRIVDVLTTQISAVGGHSCSKCTVIAQYNTRVENLGSLVDHLQSSRTNAQEEVVEIIQAHSGYPVTVIQQVIQKKTVPDFVARSIIQATEAAFGAQALQWKLKLEPSTLLPHHCEPLLQREWRLMINGVYVDGCKECSAGPK